ncbi:Putative chromo/chromo shadow domain, Chromo-like domain superfamily protein [Colletotrichum destructivum]|uniref:Chromo/chromo shadow domain, Chromo-like domain superfamily protein n=1 Tax=Colletotrichum destructivum TaxID=34406 RepID=A0AAX4I1X3_9PEZI|nr:Putative chromo/chromo shadow domain, Chromo-like domain superfamily protein [Colletotrichum destructivum]
MLLTTIETPVNSMAPADQAAGSTRCAREDCSDWAVANSRFCSAHFPYDTIEKIVAHSLDPDTALVTLTVLVKGARKDISEWDVQEHRPTLLYDYWASFKGRTRQDVLGIGELYHPFRFRRHRRVRGQWQVLVQWLGYSDEGEDVSWEPAVKMRIDAPGVMTDYCGYVDDESTKAALLGLMARAENNEDVELEKQDVKASIGTPAPSKQATKRKRENLAEQPEPVSDKRRRYDLTSATKSPPPKLFSSKRRQSQAPPDASIPPQTTPKSSLSTKRQSTLPVETVANGVSSPAQPQPQSRRKSTRAASVAVPSTTASQRLNPADVPRTMLWFMDDFTVGDLQKVRRFTDGHCTMGLHQSLDCTDAHREERTRVWWAIYFLDRLNDYSCDLCERTLLVREAQTGDILPGNDELWSSCIDSNALSPRTMLSFSADQIMDSGVFANELQAMYALQSVLKTTRDPSFCLGTLKDHGSWKVDMLIQQKIYDTLETSQKYLENQYCVIVIYLLVLYSGSGNGP